VATEHDALGSAYISLIATLGDNSLSMRKKETAKAMLAQGHKDVIPFLIGALQDQRVFDPKYLSPSAAPDAKPRIQTVGMVCESILYQIILGDVPRVYRVADWNSWWAQNKNKSLSEIVTMVYANSTPVSK
jgi:hypothetical protein